MNFKLITCLSLIFLIGCSEDKFNQNKFNQLESEFVSEELNTSTAFREGEAALSEKLLFLCRSQIKNSEATFYVLKTSALSSNEAWFHKKELAEQLLNTNVEEDEDVARLIDETLTKMNGVEVNFDEVVIGAKGKAHWKYLKSGGSAYASYLNPNSYRIDLEKTENLLQGEIETGFLKIYRGTTSEEKIFEYNQDKSEINLIVNDSTKKLTCFDDVK